MVFASSSGQFYRDVKTPYHLSGLSHLDNFIVTRKSCPLTGTLQKRMPNPDTDGNSPYHRAVSCKANCTKSSFYQDFRRTSKSFAAHPCNRPFAAKHMLFGLPGLCRLDNLSWHINPTRLPGLSRLDNFIMTRKLQPVYTGLCCLDNFIITWLLLPVYRDLLLWQIFFSKIIPECQPWLWLGFRE
jgi:hypothetical protein